MEIATSTATPERARWPRLAGTTHPRLRSLVPSGYAGFTRATAPRHLILPASASVSLVVKLEDSAYRPPQFLMGARGAATVMEGDCALLDGFLLRRLADGPRPSPEVGWAWGRLVASGGAVPIGQLVREVEWSHRHLIARSRQQVGLAPKTAARLVRFERVWRRLDQPQPPAWAELAREAGYADQAHLVREFHRFTGTTPTGFLARRVNSVQDAVASAS